MNWLWVLLGITYALTGLWLAWVTYASMDFEWDDDWADRAAVGFLFLVVFFFWPLVAFLAGVGRLVIGYDRKG